jgi:predicted negative regulator of RcsB-dependent stress response
VAKQQRMSRKEVLNRPDPSDIFATQVSAAIDWAKDNLRYILYGASAVVVVVVFFVAWTSWQGHRREQASTLLHQALKLVDDKADAKQAANLDQAIERLQAITKEYGHTPAGARASWHLGHLYFARGEMAKALQAYQVARRRLPNRQPLSSTLAILDMGYAQEATDACDEAVTSYESVLQSPIYWLRGEAYLGMGRCHEKMGATEEAIEDYDRALADVHVSGTTQQTISERLARLQPDEPATPVETPVHGEVKSPAAADAGAAGEKKTSEPAETAAAPKASSSDDKPSETTEAAQPQ